MHNLAKESNQVLLQKLNTMGILLLLDSPKHLQFGIDNISWRVGDKFKGLKLIPLGTHLITYSLKNQNHMFPIHQFIHFTNKKNEKKCIDQERIHVYRWNYEEEKFMKVNGEEGQGYRQGVRKYHFDSYLGPYPQQNVQFWASNTNYITPEVLSKLDPVDFFIDANKEYQSKSTQPVQRPNIDSEDDEDVNSQDDIIEEANQQKQMTKQQQQNIRNQNCIEKQKDFGKNIYYSQIPRRIKNQSGHINHINIDKTQVLDSLIERQWKNSQKCLLGELQYSFISFLIGQCLESYNQWKHLIILFVYSQTAFYQRKQLMQEFIIVLYEQIKQFPYDFFSDEIGKDNFLCQCFSRLQEYVNQGEMSKKNRSRISKLLDIISTKYGYRFENNQQEPVVVEIAEQYF